MQGFEVFIFISFAVNILLVSTSMFLKRKKQEKSIGVISVGLVLISIAIIISSFFVGGWAGMGLGFIGLSILIGAITGSLITSLIMYIRK
ncbi:YesK family protein [Paraliobacillus zengyii]|uniref:YesK family protein n=1 Tax=Paraliobacillus zengyii TaxID=2213194 RepID=UPI000DD2E14B|nr:YesK family protein [Paraliobacillus zengyii]